VYDGVNDLGESETAFSLVYRAAARAAARAANGDILEKSCTTAGAEEHLFDAIGIRFGVEAPELVDDGALKSKTSLDDMLAKN
jgi:hypothetical protein